MFIISLYIAEVKMWTYLYFWASFSRASISFSIVWTTAYVTVYFEILWWKTQGHVLLYVSAVFFQAWRKRICIPQIIHWKKSNLFNTSVTYNVSWTLYNSVFLFTQSKLWYTHTYIQQGEGLPLTQNRPWLGTLLQMIITTGCGLPFCNVLYKLCLTGRKTMLEFVIPQWYIVIHTYRCTTYTHTYIITYHTYIDNTLSVLSQCMASEFL